MPQLDVPSWCFLGGVAVQVVILVVVGVCWLCRDLCEDGKAHQLGKWGDPRPSSLFNRGQEQTRQCEKCGKAQSRSV